MDYGAFLGRTIDNPNRRSKVYKKQSSFEGSVRKVRGQIIKLLLNDNMVSGDDITELLGEVPDKVEKALEGLIKEGMVEKDRDKLRIAGVTEQ